ncbi:LysR family transcriptional regulator [Agrobacterium sp. rho-13.3]|uniref:LysR family transcriptional regulator n=1 Tax=Agrobacterium sp. rho-13.3 TaxID=3072980 RepID=UPI002A0F1803|nr:LysR family transcriptional regulator [Agrobacterium sp. rho-13.3]MDX8309880.1 LysR family transcriptional regulator [Agrobacterium sp. rho-13.3]
MRGSDFAELRAFASVAEHGSFRSAAAQLGMSASALSQTIRNLEERLGVRLLNRTTRSVGLSEAGARLLARMIPAIADLDAAVAEVTDQRNAPAGRLRINATRVAAMHHLAPMIGPFAMAYPDIVLDITLDERLVDIVTGGFDAGVRLGERLDKDMIAVRVGGDVRMMVVAAPAYIARAGTPETPSDLRGHRCLNYRWPTSGGLYRWEFERGAQKLDIAVEGPLVTDEPELGLRAALDGAGIAYLFEHQVDEHVAAGRLVHLLADWSPPFPGFYLYYPSRRQMIRPLRAFIDFLGTARPYHF